MLLLATVVVVLKLSGYGFFTVQTGSMAEVYPIGSIILVKPTDFESIQLGDVISYYLDDDTIVTHRVVEIDAESQSFTTQGDENNAPDSMPVSFSNVIGEPVLSINRLGYFYMFANTTKGKIVLGAVLVLAIAFSCYSKPNTREDEENEDKTK